LKYKIGDVIIGNDCFNYEIVGKIREFSKNSELCWISSECAWILPLRKVTDKELKLYRLRCIK